VNEDAVETAISIRVIAKWIVGIVRFTLMLQDAKKQNYVDTACVNLYIYIYIFIMFWSH
jgi:hypothetical protein